MLETVAADLVPRCGDPLRQAGEAFRHLAEHEERGGHAVPLQDFQQTQRITLDATFESAAIAGARVVIPILHVDAERVRNHHEIDPWGRESGEREEAEASGSSPLRSHSVTR